MLANRWLSNLRLPVFLLPALSFGAVILARPNGEVIAGHGRLEAASRLKMPRDVAVRRWQAFTGQTATLEGDGRTFDEIATNRGAAQDVPVTHQE